MIVSLIAAVAQNGVIGRANQLPWKIQDDMRFFVRTTKGHTVVTGRKNYDAMGRALPQRRNIVVTRSQTIFPDAERAGSIEEALELSEASGEDEVFVIGGAELYRAALPYAHRFYRTSVLSEVPGDVVFPTFDEELFTVEFLFDGEVSSLNEHAFRVEMLSRKTPPLNFSGKASLQSDA